RRECSRQRNRSLRRQPHHKPRTGNRGRAIGASGTRSILSPDAPAMRLDDLLGNRQPEPRILTESLMRTVSVEALEDPLQGILSYTRTVVIDDALDLRSRVGAQDADFAAEI